MTEPIHLNGRAHDAALADVAVRAEAADPPASPSSA